MARVSPPLGLQREQVALNQLERPAQRAWSAVPALRRGRPERGGPTATSAATQIPIQRVCISISLTLSVACVKPMHARRSPPDRRTNREWRRSDP